MRNYAWPWTCLAMLAAAALVGCGGSSGTASTDLSTTTATVTASTTTSTSTTGEASADDVYRACLDALSAVSQRKAESACAQVRDTFEQCTTAASNAPEGSARDTAVKACRQAADQATSQLQSSP